MKFICKRLELKIIIAVALVMFCVVGVFTVIDIRMMRKETVASSEQTLQALAKSINTNVSTAMKGGRHEDIQSILDGAYLPGVIDRLILYNDQGKKLHMSGGVSGDETAIMPSILGGVQEGDRTVVGEQGGAPFLSYYSPIKNQRECYRCHGSRKKLIGILGINFSLHNMENSIRSHTLWMATGSATMILLIMLALAGLLRRVVHAPVKELRAAMSSAETGMNAPFLSTTGEDEIADLKKSFVNMLWKINELHRTKLEAEKEIARNQEIIRFRAELQAMFNAMPDGVLLVDPDLKIMQSNPRVYELLPRLKEIGGRIPLDNVKEDACPHHGLLAVFREGKISEHQCSVKIPNGDERHVHSICAPIVENGRVTYVVEVIRDITERVRTGKELQKRTSELSEANRQLSQIAITDSLTHLSNRRHFDEILYKEIKRYNRRKYSHLSLLMIDIDHFKRLNDAHGHLVGDIVLREIATQLKEGVRETDTVARYGGEEFAIVMPDTHLDGAAYKAEKLRERIQAREFPGQNGHVKVTISIGVAAYISGTPHDLIKSADDALYQAKNSGRNTVAVNRTEGMVIADGI